MIAKVGIEQQRGGLQGLESILKWLWMLQWKIWHGMLSVLLHIWGLLMLALLVVIIVGSIFNWPWTGFYTKTFWDWLQLLIVPSVLAILTVWFNAQNSHSSTDPWEKLMELHTK